MKNRKSIYNCEFRFSNRGISSVRFYCCVFCFMLIPLNLLTSLTNTLYAKSDTKTYNESSPSIFPIPQDPNSQAVRSLRLAGIRSAEEKKEQGSREQLRRMIEQLRSVKLLSEKQVSKPIVVPKLTQEQEPNEIQLPDMFPQSIDKSDDRNEKSESQTSPGQINNITLQLLQNLSQNPDELRNPFELGEVIFISGHLKEAAIFYQEALRRIDAKDIRMAEIRAWILFQIGNSLKNNDMPAAGKIYGQLIAEYPNSPWTELAQAQANLIIWLQRDKPETLIVGNEPLETQTEN